MVRSLRDREGLSQREFAARAGTSQSTVSAYERGDKSPTLETLKRLASSVGRIAVVSFLPTMEIVLESLRRQFSGLDGVVEIWLVGSFVLFVEEGAAAGAPADLDVLVVGGRPCR